MRSDSSGNHQFKALKRIIVSSLDRYEKELEKEGLPFPNSTDAHPLDDPMTYLPSKELFESQNELLGALGAMAGIVEPPMVQLQLRFAFSHHLGGCLDVFMHANIADHLEEAGPVGISAADLAAKVKLDEGKLARILRFLATRLVVEEKESGNWAPTRISRNFTKSTPTRKAYAIQDYVGLPTWAKWHDAIMDPKYTHSYEQTDSAAGLHYDFKGKGFKYMFEWLTSLPAKATTEFGDAMGAIAALASSAFVTDFPWQEFHNRTLVDVGGGNGSFLLSIMAANPDVKGVLQDLPDTIELGRQNFAANLPNALKENRVEFEAVDFFKEQPRKGDDYVYLLRWVLHDYPDHIALQILKVIVNGMSKNSRLIIVDCLVPSTVTGSAGHELYPLTEATSTGSIFSVHSDLLMLSIFNARERTRAEFDRLFANSGLEVVKLHQPRCAWAMLEVKAI